MERTSRAARHTSSSESSGQSGNTARRTIAGIPLASTKSLACSSPRDVRSATGRRPSTTTLRTAVPSRNVAPACCACARKRSPSLRMSTSRTPSASTSTRLRPDGAPHTNAPPRPRSSSPNGGVNRASSNASCGTPFTQRAARERVLDTEPDGRHSRVSRVRIPAGRNVELGPLSLAVFVGVPK